MNFDNWPQNKEADQENNENSLEQKLEEYKGIEKIIYELKDKHLYYKENDENFLKELEGQLSECRAENQDNLVKSWEEDAKKLRELLKRRKKLLGDETFISFMKKRGAEEKELLEQHNIKSRIWETLAEFLGPEAEIGVIPLPEILIDKDDNVTVTYSRKSTSILKPRLERIAEILEENEEKILKELNIKLNENKGAAYSNRRLASAVVNQPYSSLKSRMKQYEQLVQKDERTDFSYEATRLKIELKKTEKKIISKAATSLIISFFLDRKSLKEAA